jgi:hypothetical protein
MEPKNIDFPNRANRISQFEENDGYALDMQVLASRALLNYNTPSELGIELPAMDISPADYINVLQRRYPDIEARLIPIEKRQEKKASIELKKKKS